MTRLFRALTVTAALLAQPATAQTTEVTLGGIRADTSLPVEITADRMQVDQTDGTAIFTGNVVVGQGAMRLTAPRVEVKYSDPADSQPRRMEHVVASGGVTLVSGPDAAEGQDAVYTISTADVVMTGDVLLTQGTTTLAGQRLTANLDTGQGVMEGRVAMVIPPKAEPAAGNN